MTGRPSGRPSNRTQTWIRMRVWKPVSTSEQSKVNCEIKLKIMSDCKTKLDKVMIRKITL